MIVLTRETCGKFILDSITLKETSLLRQTLFEFGIEREVLNEIIINTLRDCFLNKDVVLELGETFELAFYNNPEVDFVPENIKLKNVGSSAAKITEILYNTNVEYIEVSYEIEIVRLSIAKESKGD